MFNVTTVVSSCLESWDDFLLTAPVITIGQFRRVYRMGLERGGGVNLHTVSDIFPQNFLFCVLLKPASKQPHVSEGTGGCSSTFQQQEELAIRNYFS